MSLLQQLKDAIAFEMGNMPNPIADQTVKAGGDAIQSAPVDTGMMMELLNRGGFKEFAPTEPIRPTGYQGSTLGYNPEGSVDLKPGVDIINAIQNKVTPMPTLDQMDSKLLDDLRALVETSDVDMDRNGKIFMRGLGAGETATNKAGEVYATGKARTPQAAPESATEAGATKLKNPMRSMFDLTARLDNAGLHPIQKRAKREEAAIKLSEYDDIDPILLGMWVESGNAAFGEYAKIQASKPKVSTASTPEERAASAKQKAWQRFQEEYNTYEKAKEAFGWQGVRGTGPGGGRRRPDWGELEKIFQEQYSKGLGIANNKGTGFNSNTAIKSGVRKRIGK